MVVSMNKIVFTMSLNSQIQQKNQNQIWSYVCDNN